MSISITNKLSTSTFSILNPTSSSTLSRTVDHYYSESRSYSLIDCEYYNYKISISNCDYSYSLSLIPDLIRFIENNYGSLIFTERSKQNPTTDFQIRFEIMGTTKEMNDFLVQLQELLSLKIDNANMLSLLY